MKDKETQNNVFDILDKIEFFQGQRAGRELWNDKPKEVQDKDISDFIKDINYIRSYLQDSVVLLREEYEKLKSLYDTQKGAYMTSSIGDLPLTVKGLRKAVDEITRLNRVEAELQELKQSHKETAEKFAKLIEFHSISKRDESGYETFTISNLCMREILREEFGFTNEELETM